MLLCVKSKKAISAIVSSVLIIAISLAAVGFLYTYVITTTDKISSLSPQECINLQTQQGLTILYSSYNELLQGTTVMISRKITETAIDSFDIVLFDNEGNSESYSCGLCGDCTLLEQGTSKEYFVPLKAKPLRIKILANKDCVLNEVSLK